MLWWCPSGSPSVRPSVRPFSALFSYMLWHIELKFCTWLCFNVLQIKFECHYFASIFEGVMPLCELRIWEIHSFPHFSPTCFDILSWNFAHDFVLMYYRVSTSVISLCQFLKELCLFWNLEYRKYIVFLSFPLHALTYWAELSWIGFLTSQLTIFQSYMGRHIDVQADWRRSWTYGRAPNAIDIS